jgi:predicted nucleic acid-binding protein
MVIVDSTVWIDYFNGINTSQAEWLHRASGRQRLAVLDLIVCEVLQGIRNEREYLEVRRALQKLEIFASGGLELAIATADNYRLLRSRGRTVRKTIDCLIATYCLLHGHVLLHNDRNFDPFEELLNLQVMHP